MKRKNLEKICDGKVQQVCCEAFYLFPNQDADTRLGRAAFFESYETCGVATSHGRRFHGFDTVYQDRCFGG